MAKNTILDHKPETAIPERLLRLERNLQEFKTQVQPPKIQVTEASTVTFFIASAWSLNGGVQPDKNIISTLASPNGRNIMGIPEFSIEWGDDGAPTVDADPGSLLLSGDDRHFPEGNKFRNYSALPQWYKDVVPDNGFGISQLDLNWWYEWYSTHAADGDIVAHIRLRIDRAMQNATSPTLVDWDGTGWTYYGWWRYINAGVLE